MFENHESKKVLEHILDLLREIYSVVRPRLSATLTFKGENDMALTLLPGQQGQAVFQEWSGPSGTGDKLMPAGAVSYVSDNTSVATVDPATGIVNAVALGTANISGTDAANSLTASDVLTVAETAVSATLTLEPLTPAAAAA